MWLDLTTKVANQLQTYKSKKRKGRKQIRDREIYTETQNKNTGKKGKRKRQHFIRKALAEWGNKPYLY